LTLRRVVANRYRPRTIDGGIAPTSGKEHQQACDHRASHDGETLGAAPGFLLEFSQERENSNTMELEYAGTDCLQSVGRRNVEAAAIKLYVGNVPWGMSDEALRTPFENHGTVVRAEIVRDRHTGRSRGFGFVHMATEEEAHRAIQALNGEDVGGRPVTVQIAFRKINAQAAS
jgi:RNA recognition motif-containing protein